VLYADRHAVLDKITITDRTAAVLMSHNFKYDQAVLADLLTTQCRTSASSVRGNASKKC
jgi:xanthine/CO dehydrogenase XdhC/CoxF family maturation factor